VIFVLQLYSDFDSRYGSLKVIGTDTNRSATYGFLLTSHIPWAYLGPFPR